MLPDARRTVPVPAGYDLPRSMLLVRQGAHDPTWWGAGDEVARAFVTPEGPATLRLRARPGEVHADTWGPGAAWLLERVPAFLGDGDDPTGFRPRHPRLAAAALRHAGVRLPVHPTPVDALVAAILQQRVAWRDALRSWRSLCHAHGVPAPGPLPLRTPPDPAILARLPYEAFHPHGVERRRALAIREAASRRHALPRLLGLPPGEAVQRLQSLPGVGPWTAAMTAGTALGDPDALPLGDLHLPHAVTWLFEGRRRGTDDDLVRLLEPFRPHRWRVVRVLLAENLGPPARAPRLDGRWAPGA